MPAPETILNKIKLLLNLSASSNGNEASAASTMANKLIEKYAVTPEELEGLKDKPPVYCEDDRVYTSMGIISWKQQLLLAIAKYFECQIIQEQLVPLEGLTQFNYFVYGEPELASNVKIVFNSFSKKVEQLKEINCPSKGTVYIASYCEGIVDAIKENIHWDGINLPDLKKQKTTEIQEEKILNNGTSNLTSPKKDKEKPLEESVDVNSQSMIQDIHAYFRGLDHGRKISLNDILELDTQEIKEITDGNV